MEVYIENQDFAVTPHCFIIENDKIISFSHGDNFTREINIDKLANNIDDIITLLYIKFDATKLHPDTHNITHNRFRMMLDEIILPTYSIFIENSGTSCINTNNTKLKDLSQSITTFIIENGHPNRITLAMLQFGYNININSPSDSVDLHIGFNKR